MRKEFVLPATALVGGAAGFFLRRWELRSAFEPDSGLPIPGTPATWALIALSAVVVVLLTLLCFGAGKGFRGGYDEVFRAEGNTLSMVGMVAAAFLMAIAGGLLLLQVPALYQSAAGVTKGTPMLTMLPKVLLAGLCLASAWSLLQLGKNNFRGEGRGKFSSNLLIPAYTACMWLIVAYQARSGDPIILDYVYQLFAIIATVMAAYFVAGFGFDRAKVFPGALFSLLAMYFILVTLADTHELAMVLLFAAFFLYFGTCAMALLRTPADPRAPGGRRLITPDKLNREEPSDEG